MALLSLPDIQRCLKSPQNGAALAACYVHEERLRLHIDAEVDPLRPSLGLSRLLALPKAVLPSDKFEKFRAFIPAPLPTVELTSKIADGLSRVFEAQDGSITVELATPELETDFETYRDRLGEREFWVGTAFKAMGRAPHSVLVVDMPAQQTTFRPEPVVFALDLADVTDLALKADSTCEYLIFRLPGYVSEAGVQVQRIGVYDDGFYRVFEKLADAAEWPLYPIVENPHILGSCPARMLWSEALNGETEIARKGPLTTVLFSLDRYIYWDASNEYFKTYGSYPMLWSVEEECRYEGPQGETCHGGFVQYLMGYMTLEANGAPMPRYREAECPSCKLNKYMGPGTHVSVPAPTKERGDTRNPLGFVSVEVDALKDARLSLQELRHSIVSGVLGVDGEARSDQPQNEKQVRAGFESQQDVLVRVKTNFEKARTWVLTTIGKLRYGALYRRTVVNMGEQFYLKSPEQLSAEEVEARKAGRPTFELSQLRELRYYTQYRNNPPLLDRMRILSDLEPYPEYSLEQITSMIAASLSQSGSYLLTVFDPVQLALKADFARYLTRFESEQTDVRQFAALQPYHLKRFLITQILLSYVNLAQTQ